MLVMQVSLDMEVVQISNVIKDCKKTLILR